MKRTIILMVAMAFLCGSVASAQTIYYNTAGGRYYHADPHCDVIDEKYWDEMAETTTTYAQQLGLHGPCSRCFDEEPALPGTVVSEEKRSEHPAQDELTWLSPTIGGNTAVMVVNNGNDWRTRLNLRAEQSKNSAIRGRIYTGTRVEIYQDHGEWCTVGLSFSGGEVLTGEVMKRYLSPLSLEVSVLCPSAKAKKKTEVTRTMGTVTWLEPGDAAYVMAVCDERYFVMIPGVGQGYAPIDAFEPLNEPEEEGYISYRTFCVPQGGLVFEDAYTGEPVVLAAGVRLEDCWRTAGEEEWHITFGAGIQRSPRVRGSVAQEELTLDTGIPFGGEVYAWGRSFITVVGTIGNQKIMRRTDRNGDIFWAQGDVPKDAVLIENDLYEIKCEGRELLSQAVMNNIVSYVSQHGVLDERTSGKSVTKEIAARCSVQAALVLDPGTGKLLRIRAWLKDVDGSYVTGGDLDPKSGAITRWGCNA